MISIKGLFGDPGQKIVKGSAQTVEAVNALEPKLKALSDEELRQMTHTLRNRIAGGDTLDDLLPEAFAAVREAASRTMGLRHFDVQLIGGIVLNSRGIAEMKTGEGKTLVATTAVYLNALMAKGVHVVTVNDYLARRDAVWMGQIYSALGMSLGIIAGDGSWRYDPNHKELDQERDDTGSFHIVDEFLRPCVRREAYEADITYGTNSEFGFD